MMYIILLLPVAISTDRSTDRPCALDMCNTVRSFTHRSNTCVIRRLAFLILGFIQQMSSCSLVASTTWYRRILVCPTNRIFRSVGFFGYFGQNFGIRGAEHHKRTTLPDKGGPLTGRFLKLPVSSLKLPDR